MPAVGLECTFGHDDPLLFLKKNTRLRNNVKYIEYAAENPASGFTGRAATPAGVVAHPKKDDPRKRKLDVDPQSKNWLDT
jgi:hypothetical protein